MSAAETLDDHPYDAHMRRDPMHDAGIGIIFLTELPAHSAEGFIAPIVAWLQAAGRTVAVRIVCARRPRRKAERRGPSRP